VLVLLGFPGRGTTAVAACMGGAALLGLVYLTWHTSPAWLFTAAIITSTFNSNWDVFGFPGGFAPDRIILLAAILALLLPSAGARARPVLEFTPVHLLLGVTLLWALGSAIAAGTATESITAYTLLDRFAVPFTVFALAPFAFRTSRDRNIFLGAFVAFGGYLGLTALFQAMGLNALVFPRFISDPSVGATLHGLGGRARGPFLEAVVNGVGLYVCAVAAGVAVALWRRRWARVAATVVMALCAIGLMFTLTRSVWVGAIVATTLTMASTRELRRFLLPTAVTATAIVLATLALMPGFGLRVDERSGAERSVWERQNVNAAAVTMVSERPLLGFGLGTFNEQNSNYFPLLSDTPQVAEQRLGVHNVFLSMATELGLVGATLFVVSFIWAIGSAVRAPGPPDLRPWRVGLLAIAIFWLIVANAAPLGQVFPTMITWLWAGIILGGSFPRSGPALRW
jgi:O-antigen ligase